MSTLYRAGELGNLFARGTVTVSPAAHATFTADGICDDDPKPFWWGSLAADSYIQQRNNNIKINPGFEVALGSEWTDASSGTGSATRTAGAQHTGSYGLRCNAGAAGVGARYQSITVRAGELLRIDGWINPGLTYTGSIRIYNPTTGKWLVNGVWQAAAGDAVSVTNVAVHTRVAETTFTIEDLATCLWPTVTLYVYCYTTSNANVDFDDIALIPAVNAFAAIGHNWRPCLDVTLRYSDDAFAADDNSAATLTLARPTCYAYLSTPIYREWWRVKLGGTNTVTPKLVEGWLGYVEPMSKAERPAARVARAPMCTAPENPHHSHRDQIRDEYVQRIELDFTRWDSAPYRELAHEIDRRTYGGHGPILIMPASVADEVPVLYGRPDPGELVLAREWPVWRQALTIHGIDMPISSD
jgi:hypothetical protein